MWLYNTEQWFVCTKSLHNDIAQYFKTANFPGTKFVCNWNSQTLMAATISVSAVSYIWRRCYGSNVAILCFCCREDDEADEAPATKRKRDISNVPPLTAFFTSTNTSSSVASAKSCVLPRHRYLKNCGLMRVQNLWRLDLSNSVNWQPSCHLCTLHFGRVLC